jgi:hypothetical protein
MDAPARICARGIVASKMPLVKMPVLIWLFLLALAGAAWATQQQVLLALMWSRSKTSQAAWMLAK